MVFVLISVVLLGIVRIIRIIIVIMFVFELVLYAALILTALQ